MDRGVLRYFVGFCERRRFLKPREEGCERYIDFFGARDVEKTRVLYERIYAF